MKGPPAFEFKRCDRIEWKTPHPRFCMDWTAPRAPPRRRRNASDVNPPSLRLRSALAVATLVWLSRRRSPKEPSESPPPPIRLPVDLLVTGGGRGSSASAAPSTASSSCLIFAVAPTTWRRFLDGLLRVSQEAGGRVSACERLCEIRRMSATIVRQTGKPRLYKRT